MNTSLLGRVAHVVTLLLIGTPVFSATLYTVVDLGDLPGGRNFSTPDDINDEGQVVGYSVAASGDRAFLWDNGVLTDLGDLPGGLDGSNATGINDSGQVAGWSSSASGGRAVLWDPVNGMQDLGVLAGSRESQAYDINDSGQVVGRSQGLAFLWDPVNGMQPLEGAVDPYGGAVDPYGINATGQVAGSSGTRAFLWQNGVMIDLGDLPGGTGNSLANAINDAGQVVGASRTTDGDRAFLWDNGAMIDLGVLPGWEDFSAATDINAAGQAVGGSYAANSTTGPRGFVWDSVNGMQELDLLIDPSLGWTINHAWAINDLGQIVASGYHPIFGQHALLLTPVAAAPEPGTLPLMGCALAAMGFLRRRAH